MTELLRRALRRLNDFTATALTPVAPLGGHYRALSRRG